MLEGKLSAIVFAEVEGFESVQEAGHIGGYFDINRLVRRPVATGQHVGVEVNRTGSLLGCL